MGFARKSSPGPRPAGVRHPNDGRLARGLRYRSENWWHADGCLCGICAGAGRHGFLGLMAYAMSERTREIGIRMALGAKLKEVFRLVGGQGVTLALIGLLLGLPLAWGMGRAVAACSAASRHAWRSPHRAEIRIVLLAIDR